MSLHVYSAGRLNPEAHCENCGHLIDAGTGANEDRAQPKADDISVCAYCGQIGLYRADFTVRPAAASEIAAIERAQPELAERLRVVKGFVAERIAAKRRQN